ncbi:MAG TPA: class B sortase [Bacteroides sp.]|nr:class B sortase [Bacteroides sp.]
MKHTDNGQDITFMKQNSKTYDIIRYIVLGAAVVVFLVAAGMLIHIFMEYKKGTDIYENISSSVLTPVDKPTGDGTDTSSDEEENLPFVYDHQALLNINSEGQGYLYIPSIDLRLPVVQGTDNEYYLNHTFNKVYNAAGALFIDSRVDKGLGGSNVIIYGHNMKNGSMFAKLAYYKNESFYRQQGNDVFYIYTGDEIREYRIFDAFENDPEGYVYTCNFGTASQLQEYASTVKSYSLYDTGVDVSSATQVVTFSTCTGDGARRIIVQGIYVGSRTDKQTSDN